MSEDSAAESGQGDKHELVVYRCTDCGKLSASIGYLHAHIETKHYGFGPFNIIPDPRKFGNFDADMKKTEVLRVTDYEPADIEEVPVHG